MDRVKFASSLMVSVHTMEKVNKLIDDFYALANAAAVDTVEADTT